MQTTSQIAKQGESEHKNVRMRSIVFTINNPKQEPAEVEQALMKLNPKCYAFQLEEGAEGTPHY